MNENSCALTALRRLIDYEWDAMTFDLKKWMEMADNLFIFHSQYRVIELECRLAQRFHFAVNRNFSERFIQILFA